MPQHTNQQYGIGLARAFGGAIIFAFPLLMTMEMWWLGFHMSRVRLLLFMAFDLAMLVGLSYFVGFEKTFRWKDDVMDALAAFGVGFITSLAMLALFSIVTLEMPWSEVIGKVALQTVPVSIGAMLARKQFGSEQDNGAEEERKREAGYVGELFLMMVGALFLAFNVAPTEEISLIAFNMTPWHGLALGLASIALLHAFVYAVGFAGQESPPGEGSFLDGPAPLPGGLTGMDTQNAHAGDRREEAAQQTTPWLEWIASGVGPVLALGTFGFIGWHAFEGESTPPAVTVQIDRVVQTPSGYTVEIRARNQSGSTAAQVEIEGELKREQDTVETGKATFDYIPARSERKGGLFFKQDPRPLRLEVRALGYAKP